MEDRRGQRGVGAAAREDVGEVIERAGAARRDHRDVDGVGHGGGHLAVEAGPGAVAVHRRQQDLAGAARLGLARPLDGVARRVGGAAADVDREAVVPPLGVDRDDHRLAAVAPRQRRDQLGLSKRRGVQADLVGARVDRRSGILLGPDAAADRQRQEDLARDGVDRPRQRLPLLERRGDVEDDDFVDALDVVAARELAGSPAWRSCWNCTPLTTWPSRTSRQAMMRLVSIRRSTARKLRRICRPASPDFSGWNCTPKTLSRSTTDENAFACVVEATHSAVTGAAYECVK